MTEQQYGTIKLPREEYEQHNKKRKEMDLTWAEYVANEAPTNQREQTVELEATTVNDIARQVAEELR